MCSIVRADSSLRLQLVKSVLLLWGSEGCTTCYSAFAITQAFVAFHCGSAQCSGMVGAGVAVQDVHQGIPATTTQRALHGAMTPSKLLHRLPTSIARGIFAWLLGTFISFFLWRRSISGICFQCGNPDPMHCCTFVSSPVSASACRARYA